MSDNAFSNVLLSNYYQLSIITDCMKYDTYCRCLLIYSYLLTVSSTGLWMNLSVVAAFLASTVQRQASLQSLDPACQVRNSVNHYPIWCWKCNVQKTLWKYFSSGFYCLEGSQTATPVSSVSGGVCPTGHYCAEGSSVPSPCPAGSYQNESGAKSKDDCKLCPLGKNEVVLYELNCKTDLAFLCTVLKSPNPFWKCPQCLNVFPRLVPGFIRPKRV